MLGAGRRSRQWRLCSWAANGLQAIRRTMCQGFAAVATGHESAACCDTQAKARHVHASLSMHKLDSGRRWQRLRSSVTRGSTRYDTFPVSPTIENNHDSRSVFATTVSSTSCVIVVKVEWSHRPDVTCLLVVVLTVLEYCRLVCQVRLRSSAAVSRHVKPLVQKRKEWLERVDVTCVRRAALWYIDDMHTYIDDMHTFR